MKQRTRTCGYPLWQHWEKVGRRCTAVRTAQRTGLAWWWRFCTSSDSCRTPSGLHRRREFCHFTDAPSQSLLKRLLKGEGGAAEWQYSRRRLVRPAASVALLLISHTVPGGTLYLWATGGYFTDTPSPSILKRLLKGEGGYEGLAACEEVMVKSTSPPVVLKRRVRRLARLRVMRMRIAGRQSGERSQHWEGTAAREERGGRNEEAALDNDSLLAVHERSRKR